jgi:diguanylate cyclase (GGDEF)-like protein/PAS domain S-box-containing protein
MTELPQPPLAGMFPFYMAVDRDLRILNAGSLMLRVCPETGSVGIGLLDCFSLQGEALNFARFEDFFLLKNQTAILKRRHSPDVLFKGTWSLVADSQVLYFLGWPVVKDSKRLSQLGIAPHEIPAHTMLGDMLLIQHVNRNTLVDAQDLARRLRDRAIQLETANARLESEIAERSEVQSALVASETSLRSIFEQASVGVALIDSNSGQFLRINKRYCEMVGYSMEELKQSTFMDITHPDDLQEDLDNMAGLRAGDLRQFSLEKRYFHKDGQIVWVTLNVSSSWEPGDPPTSHIAVVQDITERKRIELELRASEVTFRKLFEDSSDAILLIDGSGVFVECNQAALVLLKMTREQFLHSPPSRISPEFQPDGRRSAESAPEMIALAYKNGLHRFDWTCVNADGGEFIVEVSLMPLQIKGEVMLHTTWRDITERKRVEELTRRSEQRNATVVRTSPIAMAIANVADGRFIEINEGLEKLFGFSRENILGRTSTEIGFWPSAEARRIWLEKLNSHGELSGYEVVLCDTNGRHHNVLISSSFIEFSDQNCIISFILDITERKTAEVELRIAATAFESQEGMFITNAEMEILRVNRAFTKITGYEAQEAVGQNPRLLNSGRHDAAFFAEMMGSLERTGGWHGEIWNRRKNGEVYPEWLSITTVCDSLGKVANYVASLTDITARKVAEEEIRNLAFYDPLTRLPNRRLLLDRLQHAMASSARSQRYCALLFIDLDNFKTLNDSLGHDTGDLLLQQVAERLTNCVREADTVARLGGDEFVVILEDLSSNQTEASSQVESAVEKILASLGRMYRLESYEIHSTPSIGITLFVDCRNSIDDLLRQADLAMYQAKAAGRNTWRFFDPKMQAMASERAAIEHGLRSAIAGDDFQLHYQPQVTRNGRLIGAEALLRWQHPQLGAISPAQFIPVAEETGLILPIGNLVLQTACDQLVRWERQPESAELTLAVNVSARQFRHADFVDQVLAAIERSGANPRQLKLELTESLLLDDLEETISKMMLLKDKGISFALDDFGTGYSSLSYLKRLPLEQLKIDRSFVRDVLIDQNDAIIAKTIVALAQSLGLDVIAEGVETAGQRDFLVSIDCHSYQGYFFGKPMAASEFESFTKRIHSYT